MQKKHNILPTYLPYFFWPLQETNNIFSLASTSVSYWRSYCRFFLQGMDTSKNEMVQ